MQQLAHNKTGLSLERALPHIALQMCPAALAQAPKWVFLLPVCCVLLVPRGRERWIIGERRKRGSAAAGHWSAALWLFAGESSLADLRLAGALC